MHIKFYFNTFFLKVSKIHEKCERVKFYLGEWKIITKFAINTKSNLIQNQTLTSCKFDIEYKRMIYGRKDGTL